MPISFHQNYETPRTDQANLGPVVSGSEPFGKNATTPEDLEAIRHDLNDWHGANDAVIRLVGRDSDKLLSLLALLRRASATDVWTKAELNVTAKLYDDAARSLRRLKDWGEARNLGLSENSEKWLLGRSNDLQLLAATLRKRAPKADKRDNPRVGRALARLIDYVRQKAKSPLYVPLALLISVATERHTEPEAVRKWWKNNATKYADALKHY
jgi:hypothetical protein